MSGGRRRATWRRNRYALSPCGCGSTKHAVSDLHRVRVDRNCQVVGPRHCLFRCPVYRASCKGAVENDAGVKESKCQGRLEGSIHNSNARKKKYLSYHQVHGLPVQSAQAIYAFLSSSRRVPDVRGDFYRQSVLSGEIALSAGSPLAGPRERPFYGRWFGCPLGGAVGIGRGFRNLS